MLRLLAVLVVVIAPITLRADTPARWRLVELWRSGGDPARQITFDDAIDMKRAANGQLLVLVDGARPQLVIIDNTGHPARAVGSGAVRFDRPNGLVQFADGRIVVNEPIVGRLTELTERGDFVRYVPYEAWGYTERWLGFVHVDGGLYEPVVQDGRLVWRRWAEDLSTFDLLPAGACDPGMVRASPAAVYEFSSPHGTTAIPVPFAQPAVSIVRAPDGSTWTGIGPDYRRIVHTPWQSCDDDAAIELPEDPVPVAPEDHAEAVARVRQAAFGIAAADPDLSRIPDVHPPFRALYLDRQLRLWIDRAVSPTSRLFDVYGPDGRAVASVPMTLPIDVEKPVVFGDSEIAFFTTGDDGWVWLVAMRIQVD